MRLQGHEGPALLRRFAQPSLMRRTFFRLIALGALVMVAGCTTVRSWFGGATPNCPNTYVAPGLDTSSQYRPTGAFTQEDIQATVKLDTARAVCHVAKSGVDVDTEVQFTITRFDPQLTATDLSYFVALSSGQNILAKQPFSLRVEFAPNQGQIQIADTIREHLPLREPDAAKNYAVIVGLQITRQQLELNRGAKPQ